MRKGHRICKSGKTCSSFLPKIMGYYDMKENNTAKLGVKAELRNKCFNIKEH